ncbi:MAG: aryl-sulfate sulfotransferase [Dehalococcoidales bacterium]|nr:aryl-sulfate sulfotransferase [Dehalococcoidales bacterium]
MPVRVYPTGVTSFNPEKCWSGFTLFQASIFEGDQFGAFLIDMNGNVVHRWSGLEGFPNKMLPGGYLMGNTAMRDPEYGVQDMVDLVQVDWDGNIVWKFNRYEHISDPGHEPLWMSRQHHDYQREGNPVGYYVPGMDPLVSRGNTLILCHKNVENPEIGAGLLLDDTLVEVTWDGRIVWEWRFNEHVDEMGFSEEARRTMSGNPNIIGKVKVGDWMHVNSASFLGPNRWFNQGDQRFHPDNIIWSSRQTNIIAITEKETGNLVWRVGPDYSVSAVYEKLGWIIGQHHAHMVPEGLPGAGNILVFDNGGSAGYGAPNPGCATGINNAIRDYSRVVEFDPVTLEVVWQYPPPDPPEQGFMRFLKLYSRFISSAQRMSNGNTLITEGGCGRLIEVTPACEIVWEYVSPYFSKKMQGNHIYRAYRVPYDWAPQADKPGEQAVQPPDNSFFRV